MQLDFVGRGVEITDELKEYAHKQIESLVRFLDEPVELRLTLEQERHQQHAELHAHHRHGVLQAGERSDSLKRAVHDVVAKMERQARKARKKHVDRRRRAERVPERSWPVEVLERGSLDRDRPTVVKSSEFPIKPMSLEEASLALEAARNDFIVFAMSPVNGSTSSTSAEMVTTVSSPRNSKPLS